MIVHFQIEGAFRLNVPPVLLSYHNEPRPWLTGLSNVSENHTYLSFFMTIEPCLQLPEVFRDRVSLIYKNYCVLNEMTSYKLTLFLFFFCRNIFQNLFCF